MNMVFITREVKATMKIFSICFEKLFLSLSLYILLFLYFPSFLLPCFCFLKSVQYNGNSCFLVSSYWNMLITFNFNQRAKFYDKKYLIFSFGIKFWTIVLFVSIKKFLTGKKLFHFENDQVETDSLEILWHRRAWEIKYDNSLVCPVQPSPSLLYFITLQQTLKL